MIQFLQCALNSNFGNIQIVTKTNVSFAFSNSKTKSVTFDTVFNGYDKTKLLAIFGTMKGALVFFSADSTASNIIACCPTDNLNATYSANIVGVFSK